MSKEQRNSAKFLVTAGAEMIGASIGGALGFLAGGPGSAALAGAVSASLTRTLATVAEKHMAQKERFRVGSVAAVAVAQIATRIERGDTPRPDFFQTPEGQSNGEQLLEGVLLKARDEYEEKKLLFFGTFYANLVFSPAVSPATAALLIKTLEQLTFRQMVILALVQKENRLDVEDLRSQEHEDPELEALKREEMSLHTSDLGSMGLLRGAGPFIDELSSLGQTLTNLADFACIPEDEVANIKNLLSRSPTNNDTRYWSHRNSDG